MSDAKDTACGFNKQTTHSAAAVATLSSQMAQNKRARLNKAKSQTGSVLLDDASNDELPADFAMVLEKFELEDAHVSDPTAIWPRPEAPPLDPQTTNLVFQQMEIDQEHNPSRNAVASRLFGVTEDGHSVVCYVQGFFPYFYCPAPDGFKEEHVPQVIAELNRLAQSTASGGNSNDAVVGIEMCMKEPLFGYHGNSKAPFFKISVRNPKLMRSLSQVVKRGFNVPGVGLYSGIAYETNLEYTIRFMVDTDIVGASWVELPAGKYSVRTKRSTFCQYEVDIEYKDLIAHEPVGDWSKVAPLRILSLDIECAGRPGIFPEAKTDPVIQIANVITLQGQKQPFIRNVFTLDTCAPIPGVHVLSFQDEGEMLLRWSQFVQACDPDVIIGYNTTDFDLPYLLDRAEALRVTKFPFLGRIRDVATKVGNTHFSSKAYGTRDSKVINMEGRVQFDVLAAMRREYKLRSFSLNAVSAKFLGEQKEDVPYSIITDLQNESPETRRRLAVYCLKDAFLPQRLVDKLMFLVNSMEMARVTGVPFNYLLSRGQQIKVVSQLFRHSSRQDLVVPVIESQGGDGQYEGATVIEPKRGYYDLPIATLDFASLYPSIMMAHNLCYTTLLNKSTIDRLQLVRDVDYVVTPTNDCFVKSTKRVGLLPHILKELLTARKQAKNEMKKETDPFKIQVLNGRQLALKISANSVYGFTGALNGRLPCLQISASVTAFGRDMIDATVTEVERQFTVANGYEHDAVVIYGDTDSVMVKFGAKTLEEAMRLGQEAAKHVTSKFVNPIKLEFEKVYFPYLLINKKRYAGLYWTRTEKYDKLDTKGLETVRRDNCPLVPLVLDTCLKMLLIDQNVTGAVEYTKGVIADLLQNKIDLSMLVITKQLSKTDYAGKQAHVELAERMRKRDAGSAPQLGDRVPYVIISGTKNAKAYEKAEDPIFVLDNNLPIDTGHYVEHQLTNPLTRIFEPILGSKVSTLFKGEHTRTIHVAAPTTGAMARFMVKTNTCLSCKTPLRKEDQHKAVCRHCEPKLPEIYVRNTDTMRELEMRYARLWTECQRCQGSVNHEVVCTNRDCPIFYMRKKSQKDSEEQAKIMERFDYSW
ncbi:DNA-directed DNA polymerase delta [Coemansia aciculifera]|uniref:DNA polymerase n=1 Tax=Coemansia aciculifera TaxID=417176 RepID=A0A9W8IJP8_9FUNG|nr:DNA-directed DNA polymerase delta [Coemansia aciculifera]KAJ2875001.1 DNA-directed DNA polymerase delta [Coemansia aciculifera]